MRIDLEMRRKYLVFFFVIRLLLNFGASSEVYSAERKSDILTKDTLLRDTIQFHRVRLDKNGKILPWYSDNLGESYNHVLKLVWNFWDHMEVDSNGLKYYMNHDVWSPHHDKRGLGADQVMMGLSSWDLLYNYSGQQAVLDNMKYMADYYLAHSLSPSGCRWPNLPFPYNTVVHSGKYDGDMVLGKDFLQPDKAGSFGYELVKLYKKTGDRKYLMAAIRIANTLAMKIKPGDRDHSPWPFKVNALYGNTGILEERPFDYQGIKKDEPARPKKTYSSYTTAWTGALNLFDELIQLRTGNTAAYQKAFSLTLAWMKQYPAKTNKWGPFFEDISGWSDCQINGITYAMFLMEHPQCDAQWKETVNHIFKWVYAELANREYEKYGVTCINEQTAYRVPGNSHTSREASVELMYGARTGDTSYLDNAIRQLNWATYTVSEQGINKYIRDDIWLTDGYVDYVRHYLRAMAARPGLSPADEDHLLNSSSVVKSITYHEKNISYLLFDNYSNDLIHLNAKPRTITIDGKRISERNFMKTSGWSWQQLGKGGIVRIKQALGRNVVIWK